MLNKKLLKNKHSQVGDATTWFVATLIIVFILIIFIYVSGILAKTKIITDLFSSSEADSAGEVSWIQLKTSFAYEISDKNKQRIEGWINENAG